jgi:hypothetical protein
MVTDTVQEHTETGGVRVLWQACKLTKDQTPPNLLIRP